MKSNSYVTKATFGQGGDLFYCTVGLFSIQAVKKKISVKSYYLCFRTVHYNLVGQLDTIPSVLSFSPEDIDPSLKERVNNT